MRTKQEKKYSRVAEGVYRYRGGGFVLRFKMQGKTTWRKLKSADLQSARREAGDVRRGGTTIRRNQSSRTVEEFSQEELGRYQHSADTTRKKVEGYHAKVVAHWPGGASGSISSARKADVEQCISHAVGRCGASYRNQFIQYLWRVFQRALAAQAIANVPGCDPGVRKRETIWRLGRVAPVTGLIPTVEQWRAVVRTIRTRKFSDTRNEAADVVEAYALLGLGQAEVASLNWQDVNLKDRRLTVKRRKTGVLFTVPLNNSAVELLQRRLKASTSSPTDRIFSIYSPKKAIAAACKDLKFPAFTPKSFRKLYIT
jgi:integrase